MKERGATASSALQTRVRMRRGLIVEKIIMKYFYCDDNNVYTMIKYYDLYHNDREVNYPTFYNRNERKRKKRGGEEGATRSPSRKLSQRSVNSILSFPFLCFSRLLSSSSSSSSFVR